MLLPGKSIGQSTNYIEQPVTYFYTIPEVTIVYTGYKKPERIVRTIEPKVDINQLSSQLMMRNSNFFRTPIMNAESADIPEDRKSESRSTKGIRKLR